MESYEEQLELSDMASDDLSDNGHEHNHIKEDDCIILIEIIQ